MNVQFQDTTPNPPGSESASYFPHAVFDSDGDTDPDADACGKGSRPGSSSFLDVSTLHLDAEVLSESGFVLESVPMLFLITASSSLVAAFRIPEGFQRIANTGSRSASRVPVGKGQQPRRN